MAWSWRDSSKNSVYDGMKKTKLDPYKKTKHEKEYVEYDQNENELDDNQNERGNKWCR